MTDLEQYGRYLRMASQCRADAVRNYREAGHYRGEALKYAGTEYGKRCERIHRNSKRAARRHLDAADYYEREARKALGED